MLKHIGAKVKSLHEEKDFYFMLNTILHLGKLNWINDSVHPKYAGNRVYFLTTSKFDNYLAVYSQ